MGGLEDSNWLAECDSQLNWWVDCYTQLIKTVNYMVCDFFIQQLIMLFANGMVNV